MIPRTILIAVLFVFSTCSRSSAQPDSQERKQRIESLENDESFTARGATITMHRRAAGTQQSDGWLDATSTGRGFTVLLHGPYNDFSQSAPTTDGSTLRVHAVDARTIEGEKFTALCLSRDDGRIPADWTTSVIRQTSQGLTVLSKTPMSISGLSGYDLKASSSSGAHLFARFLSNGEHAYQLMVEFPATGQLRQAPKLASKFFGSFQPSMTPHK